MIYSLNDSYTYINLLHAVKASIGDHDVHKNLIVTKLYCSDEHYIDA